MCEAEEIVSVSSFLHGLPATPPPLLCDGLAVEKAALISLLAVLIIPPLGYSKDSKLQNLWLLADPEPSSAFIAWGGGTRKVLYTCAKRSISTLILGCSGKPQSGLKETLLQQ